MSLRSKKEYAQTVRLRYKNATRHEKTIIHMAFFGITEAEKAGGMSSLSRRKANRIQ